MESTEGQEIGNVDEILTDYNNYTTDTMTKGTQLHITVIIYDPVV